MAELRGAPLPSRDALNALASSLSGFSQAAIDKACAALEASEPAPYAPRMPSLNELLEGCRRAGANVKKSRFCGRCTNGRLRLQNGEIIPCECACPLCEGVGVVFVERFVEEYKHLPCQGMTQFARECECRKTLKAGAA